MKTAIVLGFILLIIVIMFFIWAYAHKMNQRKKYFRYDHKKKKK